MQEEVDSKTSALAINTTKLTGRVLKSAIDKFMEHRKEGGEKLPHGKQTVKQLVGQNQGVSNIEITDKNIKDFERVARKFGVDFAVKKVKPEDKSKDKPKYIVFFKARDADAITSAFQEYTKKSAEREKRPSLLQQVRAAYEKSQNKVLERAKTKQRGAER